MLGFDPTRWTEELELEIGMEGLVDEDPPYLYTSPSPSPSPSLHPVLVARLCYCDDDAHDH